MLKDKMKINAVVDTLDVDNVENINNFAEWLAATAANDAYYMPHPQGGMYKKDMNAIQFLYIITGSNREFIYKIMENLRTAPAGVGISVGALRTFVFIVDFSKEENKDIGIFLKDQLDANIRARLLTEFIIIDFNEGTYFKVAGGKIQDKSLKNILDNIASVAKMDIEKRTQWTESKKAAMNRTLSDIRPRKKRESILVPAVLIVFLNVLVFIIDIIYMAKIGERPLEEIGIQYNQLVWEGEWWRLITSIFLHSDLSHLAGNMVLLLLISRILRNFYSDLQYLVVYLLTGIAGSICTLLFMEPQIMSLGASGAVMGLGGVLCFRMLFGNNSKFFRRAANCITIILLIGYNLFAGLSQTNINNWAHFSGFITGFLAAWLIHLVQKYKQKNNTQKTA